VDRLPADGSQGVPDGARSALLRRDRPAVGKIHRPESGVSKGSLMSTKSGKVYVKADKSTIVRRINEVLRLVLVGGDFEDIRQYAEAQGWGVFDPQLRRYQERAHQKFDQHTQHDQKQLLGRHLMQRRALYARALKSNEIRPALLVSRDEAKMHGLYDH